MKKLKTTKHILNYLPLLALVMHPKATRLSDSNILYFFIWKSKKHKVLFYKFFKCEPEDPGFLRNKFLNLEPGTKCSSEIFQKFSRSKNKVFGPVQMPKKSFFPYQRRKPFCTGTKTPRYRGKIFILNGRKWKPFNQNNSFEFFKLKPSILGPFLIETGSCIEVTTSLGDGIGILHAIGMVLG